MGNHYHLVVKASTIPLWCSMLRLQSDVARKFNKRHRYLGRLWQSRYRARVIDTQDYFRQAVSYVHLNPVEAKIVADPADYPHSGHTVEDLRSTLRRPLQVQARIEFATLAIARYRIRSTEVARFIKKHPTTIARWIYLGLRKQREDQSFRELIDTLDRRISRSVRNNLTTL